MMALIRLRHQPLNAQTIKTSLKQSHLLRRVFVRDIGGNLNIA